MPGHLNKLTPRIFKWAWINIDFCIIFVRISSSVQMTRIEKKKKNDGIFFYKNVSILRINSMIWKYKFCQRSPDGQLVKVIQKRERKIRSTEKKQKCNNNINLSNTDMKNYCVPRTIINWREFVLKLFAGKWAQKLQLHDKRLCRPNGQYIK